MIIIKIDIIILKKNNCMEFILINKNKILSPPTKAPNIMRLIEIFLLNIMEVDNNNKKSKTKFKIIIRSKYIFIFITILIIKKRHITLCHFLV